MSTKCFRFAAILLLSFISISNLCAQMPAHPDLIQRIKNGSQPPPYILQNLPQMEGKGIDAPWTTLDNASDQNNSGKNNSGNKNISGDQNISGTQNISGKRVFGNLQSLALKAQSGGGGRFLGPKSTPTGSWKALVILVQFSDKPYKVQPKYFDSLLFNNNYGTLRDFYNKVSYGSLDIVTANLPASIGWKMAPQTYSYYCNGQNGTGSYPRNSQKLVEDIVAMVDPSVGFSQYDNDHDGYVDGLFIIHTGSGAEMTGSNYDIWSHAWETSYEVPVDGVKVYNYSIEPEYWNSAGDMTIGVYAHELGHAAFGVPDLYDRDYSSAGLGRWSLMAGGSWNGTNGNSPSFPDAWSHIQMGFITPTVIKSNLAAQSVPNVENSTPTIFKLCKGGNPSKEYFLVENRQQLSYDKSLPGSGMHIYHVDENVTTQNDREWYPGYTGSGHYLVALEQADGNFYLEKDYGSGDGGDPFPGSYNKTVFSKGTFPDSKDYNSLSTHIAVKNISVSDFTMQADMEVSSPELTVISPNGGETFRYGKTAVIKWACDMVNKVKIEYTTDNGTAWKVITDSTLASDSSFIWTIPPVTSSLCNIKISDASNPSYFDLSDNDFSIMLNGPKTETEPNDNYGQANALEYSDSLTASISYYYDVDYYKFNAEKGDTVDIFAQSRPGSGLEGQMKLVQSGGTVLAQNIVNPSDFRSQRIVYVIQSSGVYYIKYQYRYNTYYGPSAGTRPVQEAGSVAESGSGAESSLLSADSGEYWLRLRKFRPSAPEINYTSRVYADYNAVCIDYNICPNGLNTTATLEYGLTSSYGSSINITPQPVNSIYFKDMIYAVPGLQPETQYHFRLTVENELGKAVSRDTAFSTISIPEGWLHQSSNTTDNLYGISFADQNTGIAVGLNGEIVKTSDGGKTWAVKNSGISYNLTSVAFSDPGTAYAAGIGGTVLKSTDKGETWTKLTTGVISPLRGIAFSGNIGIAVGDFFLIRTDNGGATWSLQNRYGNLQSVTFRDPLNVIAVSSEGYVQKSSDAGVSWLSYSYGSSYTLKSVAFKDKNTGIAAGGNIIMKTTDGANTWATTTSSEYINAVSWTGPNTVIATCDKGVTLISADGGTSWSSIRSGTTANLNAIFTSDGKTTAAGNGGKIIRSGGNFLRLTSPNGGEYWNAGKVKQIKWVSTDIENVKLELSTNNGSSWTVISSSLPAVTGSYGWTIPAISSSQCRLRISSASDASVNDICDNIFTLSQDPVMTELEPNNTKETANYFEYGDTLNASASSSDDIDFYRFSVQAGDTVDITSVNRNNSLIPGKFTLLNANLTVLADSKSFTDTLSQRIVFTVSTPGLYYIKYSSRYGGQKLPADYMIMLKKYKLTAAIPGPISANYTSCNAINVTVQYCPNGGYSYSSLEYGTAKDYGNSVDLYTYSSSYYGVLENYLIKGLQPDTWYHFRTKITNPKGVITSQDYTLKTEKAPVGWELYNRLDVGSSNAAAFWDQNTGVAAGPNGIVKTSDGGKVWQQCTNSPNFLDITVASPSSAFAVGSNNMILRTTNKGSVWDYIYPPYFCTLAAVGFFNSSTGITAGENNIFITTNGGSIWNKISFSGNNTYNYYTSISIIDQTSAMVLTKAGRLFKTNDAGATWTELPQPTTKPAVSVSFIDRNNGMIAGNNLMLKTTDGGTTWKEIFIQDTTRFGDIRSVKYVDQNVIIAAGSLGKVYVSIDRGKTWKLQQTGTTLRFNDIAMAGSFPIIAGEGGAFLRSNGIDMVAWKEKITVNDGGNANSQALYIGCSVAASDIIDPGLGEYILPPAPPAGAFDARLKLPEIAPGIPGDQSLLDYRNDSLKTINWTLSFQTGTGGNPITINWDPALLPEGSFFLKDNVNGTIVNINMKAQSSYTLTNPEINSLKIEYRKMLSSSISLSKGWNIASIPVVMTDMSSSTIFPQASAPIYGFMSGYQTSTILETAKGYWVRYPENKVINLSGTASAGSTTIPLNAGWNLIGPYDNTIQTSSISTTPTGILTSPFYSFMSSYQIPSILEPGKGYWIRSSQSGTLNLGGKVEAKVKVKGIAEAEGESKITMTSCVKDSWGKLIIQDNMGNRGVLYISNDKENLSLYELPPMPPSGIFDLRYSTDRIVENINSSSSSIKISSANYPITITSDGMDIRLKDKIDGRQLNITLNSGKSVTIQNSSIDNIMVEPIEIPLTYDLKQNYPNPFNPQTTISYSIPEKTYLKIIIYNQLGETVEELINSPQEPGTYKINWKPSKYASGIYFLHMATDSYKQTIKMLYLK